MTDSTLKVTIDTLYDIRKELRRLQEKARIYNEQIIDELEQRNGTMLTDSGIKAALTTRVLTQFNRKAALAENADFVTKHTTLKTVTVLQLT